MILEGIALTAIPIAIGAAVKAVQVATKVDNQEADISYIRGRVDKILDHLIEKKG